MNTAEMAKAWRDHRFEDLELHVRTFMAEHSPHTMDFVVYPITEYDDGNGEAWKFISEKPPHRVTHDHTKARSLCGGYIKWDGCINYDMGHQHACGREEMTMLGPLFDRLYDIALDRMPGNEEWLAKRVTP